MSPLPQDFLPNSGQVVAIASDEQHHISTRVFRVVQAVPPVQGPPAQGSKLAAMTAAEVEARVREICLALPEVSERTSHGSPAFFVGKQFVMLWPEGHHEHRFPHLWCAAPTGAQAGLMAAAPERFFRPPYVGGRGWVGLRLDGRVDWEEVEMVCEDAYRAVAPKRLLALLPAHILVTGDLAPESRGPTEMGMG